MLQFFSHLTGEANGDGRCSKVEAIGSDLEMDVMSKDCFGARSEDQ